MNASPSPRKAPTKRKRPIKRSPKASAKKAAKNGSKAHADALRREAKADKKRSGTKTVLDYCEMIHRRFMDQQNDPNPLRKFITVEELAAMFQFDKATITRYLAFMRTRLHLPIAHVRERGGQGYTEKVYAFPLHTFTKGDMFLFVVAKGALGKGSPFAEKFPPLCAKVEKALQSEEVDLKKLESIVHFHNAGSDARVHADPQLWDFLASVSMDCREISFEYLKAEPGATPTRRVIKPLSLHEIGRAWYIWCPNDEEPGKFKKFALSRMSRVERTGNVFEPIAFNPTTYLKSVGAFTGEDVEKVHLRAYGKTACHLEEKPLHDSQELIHQPDGTADIFLELAITPELEDLISQRAGRLTVVSPLSLRERIHEMMLEGAALNA